MLSNLSQIALHHTEAKLSKILIRSFLILCLFGLPLSLYRWSLLGFLPIYVLHICITLAALYLFFFPSKTEYKRDIFIFLLILMTMGIAGILQFGLQAGTHTFIVFIVLLTTVIWGKKYGIYLTITWSVILFIIGNAFIFGIMKHDIAVNEYAIMPSAWLISTVGALISCSLSVICISMLVDKMQELYQQVEDQKSQIQLLADYDELTNLPVPRLLETAFEQCQALQSRRTEKIAICFIDIDKFKHINDTYGHAFGDACLITLARTLKRVCRVSDTATRLGGDEFVVLLNNVNEQTDIEIFIQRLFDELRAPIEEDGFKIHLEISVGVYLLSDTETDFDTALHNADKAMYHAKKTSGNTFDIIT